MNRRPERTAADIALLAQIVSAPSATTSLLAGFSHEDAASLIELARLHGLEAWLAGVINVDDPNWAVLAEQRLRFIAARARARSTLGQFGEIAQAQGWPWLLVKGQALAEDVYPAAHFRFGVDVDILVEPEAFRDVLDTLPRNSWQLVDRNWPLLAKEQTGELRLRSPQGQLIDLHWHLLNDVRHRRAFRLDSHELIARRRILASGLPALSIEDQFVHVGLHAALGGANKLMWLLDTYLAGRRVEDWSAAARAVERAGALVALSLVMQRIDRWLLPSPFSSPFLCSFAGRRTWRAICGLTDRLSPLDRDPAAPRINASLARSSRATVVGTLSTFLRHGTAYVASGAPKTALTELTQDLRNEASQQSPLFDAPLTEAREAYLAMVSAGA